MSLLFYDTFSTQAVGGDSQCKNKNSLFHWSAFTEIGKVKFNIFQIELQYILIDPIHLNYY